MKTHQELYKQHWREFEQIFGVPLSHWHNIFLGLDIVGLTKFWEVGQESTEQFIEQEYGQRAAVIVKELINENSSDISNDSV